MSQRTRQLLSEGILIVVSILVAFTIDAWWEERQERNEEQRLLLSLKHEFQTNIETLPSHIDGHLRSNRAAVELARRQRQAAAEHPFEFHSADLAMVINHGSTDPQTVVLDAMLQSGELRYISNPEIRERLGVWPRLVIDATENELLLRNLWEPRLLEALGERTDISPLQDLSPDCWQDGSLEECRQSKIQVSRSTKVIAILGPVAGYTAEAARELQLLKQEAEKIVDLIETELSKN